MKARDVLQGTFDDRIGVETTHWIRTLHPRKREAVPATLRKEHLKFKFFVSGYVTANV